MKEMSVVELLRLADEIEHIEEIVTTEMVYQDMLICLNVREMNACRSAKEISQTILTIAKGV